MSKNYFFLLAALSFLAAGTLCHAESLNYSLGIGFDYRTGDYGTDESTDSYVIPLIVDIYPSERFDLELVIPYLIQSSTTTVLADGQRLAVERPARGRRSATDVNSETEEIDDSENGLGDITLTGGYVILEQDDLRPRVRPYLYLKFPTADETDGLGTGEFDFGAGIDISGWFDSWFAQVSSSYIFQGENDDFDLKDYLTYSAEAGRQLNARFFSSVSLWGASAPSEQSSSLFEAHLNGTFWFSRSWSLEGYLAKGLSEDSPDFGAGVTLFRHF